MVHVCDQRGGNTETEGSLGLHDLIAEFQAMRDSVSEVGVALLKLSSNLHMSTLACPCLYMHNTHTHTFPYPPSLLPSSLLSLFLGMVSSVQPDLELTPCSSSSTPQACGTTHGPDTPFTPHPKSPCQKRHTRKATKPQSSVRSFLSEE